MKAAASGPENDKDITLILGFDHIQASKKYRQERKSQTVSG